MNYPWKIPNSESNFEFWTVETGLVLVLVVMAEVAAAVKFAIDGADQHHGVDRVPFVKSATVVAAVALLSVAVLAVLTESDA